MKAAPHSVGPKATCLVGLFHPVTSHLAESVWSPHPAGEGRDACSGPSGWPALGRGHLPLPRCRRALRAPAAGVCAPGSHASVRSCGAGRHTDIWCGKGLPELPEGGAERATPGFAGRDLVRLGLSSPCTPPAPFLVLRLRPGHVWSIGPGRLAQLAECTCHRQVPAGPGCAMSRSRLGASLQACSLPIRWALSTVLSLLLALLANLHQPLLWLHC